MSQSEMLFHESKINLKRFGWFKGVFIFVIVIGEEQLKTPPQTGKAQIYGPLFLKKRKKGIPYKHTI